MDKQYQQALEWYRCGKYKQAAEVFENLLESDYQTACILLGLMLVEGKGVDVDVSRGLMLLHRAADKGETAAMLHLAELYYRGEKVESDHAEVVFWINRATNMGDKRAAMLLQGWYDEKAASVEQVKE